MKNSSHLQPRPYSLCLSCLVRRGLHWVSVFLVRSSRTTAPNENMWNYMNTCETIRKHVKLYENMWNYMKACERRYVVRTLNRKCRKCNEEATSRTGYWRNWLSQCSTEVGDRDNEDTSPWFFQPMLNYPIRRILDPRALKMGFHHAKV